MVQKPTEETTDDSYCLDEEGETANGLVMQEDMDSSSYHLPRRLMSSAKVVKSQESFNAMSKGHPDTDRSFQGQDIDIQASTMDTSLLSLESKDLTVSGSIVTATEETATVASFSSTSDSGTEASSVALLRGWLDDFGKQHKTHYEKTAKHGRAPADATLEKPVRPKIQGSLSDEHSKPTPLMPHAASALAKRISAVEPRSAQKDKTKGATSISHVTSTGIHRNRSLVATSSFATPIRYKPKIKSEEVQATNDGYASVAKLSAWLADDPTKSKKKVKTIRRGANVIAKSRKFDKGLADVIVEETNMRTGSVTNKKHQIEMALSTASGSLDEQDAWCGQDASVAHPKRAQSTIGLSDSSISVGAKKQWLANAFSKNKSEFTSMNSRPGKAATEIVTSDNQVNGVSLRAKERWRQRTPPRAHLSKSPHRSPTRTKPLLAHNETDGTDLQSKIENASISTETSGEMNLEPTSDSQESYSRSAGDSEPKKAVDIFRPQATRTKMDTFIKSNNETAKEDESDKHEDVGFHAARALLVKRAKQNGNKDVEILTKVNRRKALFEKMSQDNRRKSMPCGLLKPTWQPDSSKGKPTGPAAPSKYTKSFVADIAPKKSFEELP